MNNDQSKKWQDDQALERYRILAPLLDQFLDSKAKNAMRQKIAAENGISTRTIYRWESYFNENGFTGLKPQNRERQYSSSLPSNFDDLLNDAIQLKREVPLRSVSQIIYILETEGKVEPGALKRSTLQRYLYNAGFGKKQLKKYSEAMYSSSKRFCKPHRMMLLQGDIKYGIQLPIGKDGRSKKTYLSCLIDDHSRMIVSSEWYDTMEATIVEDTLQKCLLSYGKPDYVYFDNGKQYVAKELKEALSKLSIGVLHHRPYACSSKGKIERFNESVDSFLREAAIQKPQSLQELNKWWHAWVDQYYHNKPHDGITEYYKSMGWAVPEGGITPLQEWHRDSRRLTFLDPDDIAEAFLHHVKRRVDKAGCISVNGRLYETSTALIGANVIATFDPNRLDHVTISYDGIEDFEAQPVEIGEFCSKAPTIPLSMLPANPETSRFLDAISSKEEHSVRIRANAISFSGFRKDAKEGRDDYV